jgi:hypothetical protein
VHHRDAEAAQHHRIVGDLIRLLEAANGSDLALLHGPLRTDQHVRVTSHVARDEHGLADFMVHRWYIGVTGREGARGAFAMHRNAPHTASHFVFFPFGDVVRHVVHL